MRWWEQLYDRPCQPDIPVCGRMSFMRTVGFMSSADSKSKTNERMEVDGYVELYRSENPIQFDDMAYNVIRDTHVGVINSVKKYDHTPDLPPDFREDVWQAAVADTLQDFAFMRKQAKVRSRGEVVIDPDRSPGPVYKWLGCRTKLDGVLDFPKIDEWLWQQGYALDYPVLFKQAGKVELVKRKKLDTNDIRGFTVAPLDFVIYSARLKQDFDEKISKFANDHGHNPVKVGMVMQYGGFTRWAEYLERRPGWIKISEDAWKYDSSWIYLFARVCAEVRTMANDDTVMSEKEFRDRIQYDYEQNVVSFILLPNGEVVQKFAGLNSGTVGTSYDGSISHTAQSHYVARRCSGLNADPDGYGKQKRNFVFGVYSDDKNSAVSPAWAPLFSFEARAKAYAELGIKLDREKDIHSQSLAGHQWLGKTFALQDVWVPVANHTKILCSLRNLEGSMPIEIRVARALGLMVEATFTPVFDWIRSYLVWLVNRAEIELKAVNDYERWLFVIPTHRQCVRFWLGQE